MARPRTPSNVLELHGAFKKNPQRKRKDPEGAGPFSVDPPAEMPGAVRPRWNEIVARLPKVALTSSDEIAVEAAAHCLHGIRELGQHAWRDPLFGKLSGELRAWLGKLGMTPQDRTRIAPLPEKPNAGNPFSDV